MRVYTLGTDHRHQLDFVRILVKHGIEVVFDVRRTPAAQEEHFRRDGLQALCAAHGVDYVFLGNELGGPRDGDRNGWVRSDEFIRGTGIIQSKAARRVCCILCAERSPERCHRLDIAAALARAGIEVVHLLDETTVWQAPAKTPPARQHGQRGSGGPRRWRRNR